MVAAAFILFYCRDEIESPHNNDGAISHSHNNNDVVVDV